METSILPSTRPLEEPLTFPIAKYTLSLDERRLYDHDFNEVVSIYFQINLISSKLKGKLEKEYPLLQTSYF